MAHKILVVDDEVAISKLLQSLLKREGYEVCVAYDGLEALQAVSDHHPNLILLDVMMPNLDGFGTLKRLKENPDTADIPVVMLTARADDTSVVHGWDSGADSYLTKPFNPLELISFVRRILDGAKS